MSYKNCEAEVWAEKTQDGEEKKEYDLVGKVKTYEVW